MSLRVGEAAGLQLQRLVGNAALQALYTRARTSEPTVNPPAAQTSVQRYHEQKTDSTGQISVHNFFFETRKKDLTATTGVHNYAVELGHFGNWARSQSNRHAEVGVMLAHQRSDTGEFLTIVSEFKPCRYCRADMEKYEADHGLHITCVYLIDYEGTGDGDKERLRGYYKGKGLLEGGGEYTYRIVD